MQDVLKISLILAKQLWSGKRLARRLVDHELATISQCLLGSRHARV
jgi:hypothetical protein